MAKEVPEICSWDDFVLERVLNSDSNSKMCSLLVKTKINGIQAVVTIEKSPFSDSDFGPLLDTQTQLKRVFQNDIYSQHFAYLPMSYSQAKLTIICPCTEKHIRKYSKQELYCIRETPADYAAVTVPFLQKHQFDMKVPVCFDMYHNLLLYFSVFVLD
jgi:m7GpppX diphosphatase